MAKKGTKKSTRDASQQERRKEARKDEDWEREEATCTASLTILPDPLPVKIAQAGRFLNTIFF